MPLGFPIAISGLLYLDATGSTAGDFKCNEQQIKYYTERCWMVWNEVIHYCLIKQKADNHHEGPKIMTVTAASHSTVQTQRAFHIEESTAKFSSKELIETLEIWGSDRSSDTTVTISNLSFHSENGSWKLSGNIKQSTSGIEAPAQARQKWQKIIGNRRH